ncbi:MAG: asparagine synthase (glutamine-hydrolyzing) [Rhodocyclaceae bacterium]|nr:asparagine synthase (glutamine-hydrolyzing) [Zoogloeaceae bacterium]MCG3168419.1 Asparagine synthetase [glutamine-hydrolyzing] 1 [Bacteroidia bacterium]MCQ3922744.1 asparagine synthase (glutamine-hydrolyzing) [Rhodocyclaceae bacterium]HNQ57277.1 asparagine synthase (glutamine-hydrolyzing) [Candidatus Desulfobacillus denitrificans]HNT61839.1 asparagine synthase (glutamine-hydrolyzing) [Candidatus Desulfobacillus denitrificans]
MCGIFGVVAPCGGLGEQDIAAAGHLLRHRGPDDSGLWLSPDGRAALGHRRLSILDLSAASHQPMPSPCGRYVIVFNGEIYNFAELRTNLIRDGVAFTSAGDTEVVLAAYLRWGERCLERLNGMFAFAILDRGDPDTTASLFFARDRAGEKPFYYRHADGRFAFASELKGLDHPGRIDLQGLNYYLALGYVPGDLCLFDGVRKLPSAHCGRLMLQSGQLSIRRYWALPENHPVTGTDGEVLADEAARLIEDSVRLRLVADVPVGVLLSGGLDSSLVAAAAARVAGQPVETFTITVPGSPLDEARHAEVVARHFGTRHNVLPMAETGLGHLDGLAPFVDEPIADSSILPAWMVFGLARKKVTVALGGDGGDELFGGYGDYTASLRDWQRLGWIPRVGLKATAAAASLLPAGVRGRNRVASLRGGPLQQMIWGSPYFDRCLRTRLLDRETRELLRDDLDAPEGFLLTLFQQGRDPIDCMTRTHFGSILPDDFLVKVDRASMAHSLEVRAPFLDHRLIEFAFGRVPSEWKVRDGESRRLQRMLARRWLPSELDIDRKQGFSIPMDQWLRSEGEDGLRQRLAGLPDCIERGEVDRLIIGHFRGRTNGARLFALIMLAIAYRNSRK